MHFFNITFFGLLAIASAVPAVPFKRSAASIKSEITTVNNQLHVVDNDITHYTGGLLGPFQILVLVADVTTLENDAKTLSIDVVSTGALGASDSADIATGVAGVVTTLCTTLADAVAKKQAIADGGYTTTVHNGLADAQGDIDDFFNSLESTIDPSQLASIVASKATADNCFATTLAAI